MLIILLDREIPKDHGVFFPKALSDELISELRVAPVGSVVIESELENLAYELNYIQLGYEVIYSQDLADEGLSNYKNGKRRGKRRHLILTSSR